MMAKLLRSTALRRALDPMLATALAGATGFVLFVMPGTLIERVVTLSGLPGIFPMAAPPLGDTARIAIAAAGALASGAIAFAGLHLAGRPRRPVSIRLRASESVPELRRADAHPDAPARRPIFAMLDLGQPMDEGAISVISKGWPAPSATWDETSIPAEEPIPVREAFLQTEIETAIEPERIDEVAIEKAALIEEAAIEEVEEETPAVIDEPAPEATAPPIDEEEATVASLMARLEAGLERLEAREAQAGGRADRRFHGELRETLNMLRPLANGAR